MGRPRRTAAACAAVGPDDADAYAGLRRLVRSLGAVPRRARRTTPPDIEAPGSATRSPASGSAGRSGASAGRRPDDPAGAADGRRRFRGRVVRDRRPAGARRLARRPVLRAMGRGRPGRPPSCSRDAAGNDGGAAGQTVFAGRAGCAGGGAGGGRPGGRRRDPDRGRGRRHHRRDGRAIGVVLASGEEIAAPDRRGRHRPEAPARRARRSGRPSGRPCAGGPATSGPPATSPRSTSRSPGCRRSRPPAMKRRLLRGRIAVGAPAIDAIERAFDAASTAGCGHPFLEATIPSLVDPALVDGAPGGRPRHERQSPSTRCHGCARATGTSPRRARRPRGRRARGARAGHRPAASARQVITPLDLERDYGLTGGHPLHGEPGLDQFFLWRPLLGHARYRMPVEGLYLAGSGAHPGRRHHRRPAATRRARSSPTGSAAAGRRPRSARGADDEAGEPALRGGAAAQAPRVLTDGSVRDRH